MEIDSKILYYLILNWMKEQNNFDFSQFLLYCLRERLSSVITYSIAYSIPKRIYFQRTYYFLKK